MNPILPLIFTAALFSTSLASDAAEPSTAPASLEAPKVTVLEATVVNDSVDNAQLPMGVARVGKETLIAAFCDGADLAPGGSAYLVRSDDLGKTWSEPYMEFKPAAENQGIGIGLAQLPNGDLWLTEMVETYHSDDRTWRAVFKGRSSKVNLKRSRDGGKTFEEAGNLDVAPNASMGLMGTVVALDNGDWLMPAFAYPGARGKQEGYLYGSGYFRSSDEGQTWSRLEIAFKDPVEGRDKPLFFNEAAYVQRPDGSIIAYARIDSEGADGKDPSRWLTAGNNLWWIESKDHGKTWSEPKETNIGGIFPAIVRLGEDRYLMICGNRHENPTRRTCYYTSRDGLNFELAGYAPYVRTNGACRSTATGGSQSIIPIDDHTVYFTYYAADPTLHTLHKTYIEGALLEIR